MKVRVKWIEDVAFLGETESGHGLVIDGAPAAGGRNLGARPLEMLLLGVGGCSAFDVVLILKKMREPIEDVIADVTAERADNDPKVFTKLHLHFKVKGKGLSENKVKQAIQLSAEKYCSASIMLGKAVDITHDFKVIET
tara:strand:- start:2301 stop:2717 length:417 start_codon:yes stop_codon:yes gene_type:complete